MNIIKENIDPLNALIKIQIAPEDYRDKVEDSIKDLRKKIELKGFRKGHTPVGIIKKLYGNSILADELNKIINEQLNSYIKDNQIEILGDPLPKTDNSISIDINEPKHYEFAYELGLAPEFELPFLSKQSQVTYYKIKVDDELLNKEIDALRKRYGKMTNPEDHVKLNDVLYVELDETHEDGTIKENGHHNHTAIPLDMITDEPTKNTLLNMKPGESAVIDIFKMFGNKTKAEIAKHFLNIDDEAGINTIIPLFKLTLKKINRIEPAVMDRDFFDRVLGPGKAANEEEFRTALKHDIEKYFGHKSKKLLHLHLIDNILNQTIINLPDDFLKRWLKITSDKPLSDEEITQQYPPFVRSLKWRLIVNKLIRENNIEVTPEEMKTHTRKSLQEYLNVDDETMATEEYENWVGKMMHNKEYIQNTFDQLLMDKLLSLMEEQITVVEKEVSLEEFQQIS
jgi:trigger factor